MTNIRDTKQHIYTSGQRYQVCKLTRKGSHVSNYSFGQDRVRYAHKSGCHLRIQNATFLNIFRSELHVKNGNAPWNIATSHIPRDKAKKSASESRLRNAKNFCVLSFLFSDFPSCPARLSDVYMLPKAVPLICYLCARQLQGQRTIWIQAAWRSFPAANAQCNFRPGDNWLTRYAPLAAARTTITIEPYIIEQQYATLQQPAVTPARDVNGYTIVAGAYDWSDLDYFVWRRRTHVQ